MLHFQGSGVACGSHLRDDHGCLYSPSTLGKCPNRKVVEYERHTMYRLLRKRKAATPLGRSRWNQRARDDAATEVLSTLPWDGRRAH